MKKIYIPLIGIILAFLLIPIDKINAQTFPGVSEYRLILSSYNVRPNTPVHFTAPQQGCSGKAKWFNDNNELVAIGQSLVVSKPTVGEYSYYYDCEYPSYEDQSVRTATFTVSNAPKSPTPNVSLETQLIYGSGQVERQTLKAIGCAGLVTWLSGKNVIAESSSIDFDYSFSDNSVHHKYTAYCTEYGKTVSDAAEISIGELNQANNLPQPQIFGYPTESIGNNTLIANQPTRLGVYNCYGTVSWSKNGVAFSTELSPLVTPQCGDYYELKCTYDRWICSGGSGGPSYYPGERCCDPSFGNGCPDVVKYSYQISAAPNYFISISAHPQSQTALAGSNINLSVTASYNGGYQWRKNGNNIDGAVSSSYTILNSTVADAGEYDVIVKGANTCSADEISDKATITISSGATLTMSSTAVTCNGGTNGTATVNATGGNLPYTYVWSNGGNTATITGLIAGTYTVTVTDANNVPKSSSIVVTEPTAIVLTSGNTAVTCNGGTNGTATVNVSGGTGAYTYSWSGGVTSTTNTATGLAAGTYTVTVKDANNCEKSIVITVTEPTALVLTPSSTAVKCKGGNDGIASVSVSGGTGAYNYSWSSGVTSTGNTATGLAAGNYTVTVKDANNCEKNIAITVNEPSTLLTVTISSSTNISCNGTNNGIATGQVTGGSSPYTYLWSNGNTNLTANNLGPGVNTLQVTDANGCIKTTSVTIAEPAVIVLTPSTTAVKCNGGSDGTASVSVTGGTGAYTYSWSGGVTSTTNSAMGLAAGNYTVTVKDANNCEKNIAITVTQPDTLVLTPSNTAVKCNGGSDGTASVSVTGGTGAYTYSWSGGVTSTTNTATGLAAGTYTVTVKDANNCEKSIAITITEPTAIVLTSSSTAVKCKGGTDGTASVSVSGGTGAYTYSWSGGVTSITNTASGLAAGTYTVTVKDANNCEKSIAITVNEPSTLLTVSISGSTNISCNGANNGIATGQVTGGNSPYTYLWSNGNTNLTANNLGVGVNTLQVTDANGCTKTTSVTIVEPAAIVLTPSTTAVKCNSGSDGTASVSVTGGTGAYTYSWSGGITSTTNTATGLAAGDYTVIVKDANNCQQSITITVTQPDAIVLTTSSTAVKCNGGSDGTATVNVSGGTGAYTYSWSGGVTSTTNTATGLAAGSYTVTVKDANNCEKSIVITVTEPTALVLTPSSTAVKCKGGTDGTATVNVSGGTGAYTYSWSGGVTSTTNTASGLAAGTYTVTVKDANNCEKSIAITVNEPSTLLTVTISSSTNISCNGANNGIATGQIAGGNSPYTYLWSNGNTNLTANNLGVGLNTLQVTDANGCIKTTSVNIVEPSVIVLTPNTTAVKCNGGSDGTASVSVTGGTGAYTYSWSGGVTSTTNTATGLAAGNYTVTVKDANNCEKSVVITVTEPTAITLNPSSTAVKCNGGSDGTASVSVTGGTGAYTYSWSGGVTSTTNTATGLAAGTYTITVKDANNCEKSIAITITEPTAIVLTPSSTAVKCKGGSDGTATVSVSGGTGAYTYSWSGGVTSTTNTASGLAAGTYTVTVKDANNCEKSIAITVNEPSTLLTVTISSSTNISCNGANNGIATGQVAGGNSPYTYLWSNGNTNLTANNLGVGVNTLQVTDANGCIKTTSVTIVEPAAIVLTPSTTAVKCNGGSDGTASVSVTGGTGAYTYSWSGGITSTTNSASGLAAGTYTVTVKDANNCQQSITISVTEPDALLLTSGSTAVKCNGGSDGTASVSVSGGESPYTYSWSGGVTSTINTATGLAAGTYTVTVKDANNCEKSIAIIVAEPTAISLTSNSTAVKCKGGSDGTATVSVSGGTGAYSYSWSGGVTSTTNTATGLLAGSYTVTVKDANNCEKSIAITVNEPSTALTLTSSSTAVKCNGGSDGTAGVSVSGGTAPYTYSWNSGITSTTNVATGLAAGTYTVTVKDANNCEKSLAIIVLEPAGISLTPSSAAVKCKGGNDGTAAVSVSGGASPYTYSWSGGVTSTTNTAIGLTAGNYTVTVKDANNCDKSIVITVTEPTAIVLTPSSTAVKCNGGSDGTASVSVSGGTAPYTYSWIGGVTSTINTATGLTAGTYTVTVKDANNCEKSIAIIVTEPTAISLTSSSTAVKCKGGSDGTATVSVIGGSVAYTYSWSGGVTSTTNTAMGLAAGTYTVTVKDANNCEKSIAITVNEPSTLLTVTISSSTNITCGGANNGIAIGQVTGGGSPYTYLWNNGNTNLTANNLGAGVNTLQVTDVNGCVKSASVTITEPTAIVAIPSSTPVKCKGGNDGTASVSVSGGTAPYTYSWSGGVTSTTNTATGLVAGNYTVTVKDANNCQRSIIISVVEPTAILLTPSSTAVKCNGGSDGTATVSVSGGTGAYTYSWSGGVTSTTSTATGLVAGTYTVTVKDANNCEKSIAIAVTESNALTLTSSSVSVKCKGGNDGTAGVSVSGGKTPYSYSWSGGVTSNTNTATALVAGTYTVTVKDANNCQKSIAIIVSEPTAITLTPSSTAVKCNGGNDGTASVSVSGGTGAYTYSWSGGIMSTTNTATGLAAGTYAVTVKDGYNCQKSILVGVSEPTAIVLTPSSTPVKCKGGSDGTASVSVSNGTGAYTYSWSGGVTSTTNTATDLVAGNYTVTVKDANNCQRSIIISVIEPTAIVLTPSSTAVKCNGGNDGTASVSVSGGTGAYTYSWSGGVTSTTNTATALAAGTYTVTVKDANNCQKSISITVTEPNSLTLTTNSTAAKCQGGNDGTAGVSVSGGKAPYSYSWSGGVTSTTNTVTGLTAGTYTVTVKDANNCQKSIAIIVTEPTGLTLTPSSIAVKCSGDGTAMVSVSGGISPYSYSWDSGITSTTNVATGLPAGTYTVTVKDANNCLKSVRITIDQPAGITLTPSMVAVKCKGGNDGTASVSVTGGTAPYTYSWSNGIMSTTNQATGLAAGTYTVIVKDANNCEKSIAITVTEPEALTLTPNSTAVKCKGGNDGTASVSVSGGTGAYTYSWSGGITSTTNTATDLAAGTYTVTVKDVNNCQKSIAITVTEPNALTLTSSSVSVKCKGGSDGTAGVIVSGGTAPYSYSWSGGVTSTANTVTGLTAGTYTVTVKDANNCQKIIVVNITEPATALTLTSTGTAVKCNGGNDGTAGVSVSGGTAPYSYSWSGGITSTSNVATGLSAGTYTVTVKDANNCQNNAVITVTEPTGMVLTSTFTAVKCKGGNDGTAGVSVSGGTAPYSYSWSGGVMSTANTATGLSAGTYTVTVKDANNCQKSLVITVTEPGALVLIPSSTAANCAGSIDGTGTASVSVTGGTAPYTYSWSGGIMSTANTATGLAAGTYTVTVKDANNCQNNVSITVTEPTGMVLIPSSVSVKCKGGSDGTAGIIVSGGTAPYSYSWSGGVTSTANTATGLTAGTYTVTVKDANNCQKSIVVNITEPATVLTLTSTATAVKCNGGNDGTAGVSVSGGTAPYTYSWSGGIMSTANTATGLAAGTYTVTVKDANNCQSNSTITVTEPTGMVLIPTFTAVKCKGGSDGTATVSVSGGTAPYSYSWSGGVTSTTNTATGLSAGEYTVIVKDANNCQKNIKITVTEPTSLTLTPTDTAVKCNGGSDGTAGVSVSGGTAPYSYSWSGGVTSTTNTAVGLLAGTYTVTVKDANNCQNNSTITVTEPIGMVLTPTFTAMKCKGGNDGTASVSVSGGTAPYSYSWSGGVMSTANTATGLSAGTYTVTVKDANNCQKSIVITVTEPGALVLIPSSTAANCAGSTDGTAGVSVTGGTAPYTYSWSGGITSTSNVATGLSAGTYTVTVKDANNCQNNALITVTEPDAASRLVVTPDIRPVKCFGGTGSASVSVTGGSSPYTYLWSNGAISPDVNNVSAGNYTVVVKDSKGCSNTKAISITAPTEIVLTPTIVNVKCKSNATGRILMEVSGGTAPYTYLWSNGSKSSIITGLIAGTYSVTVTDVTNCTKTMEMTITEPEEKLQQFVFRRDVTCKGGATGLAGSTPTGGTAPYTYLWSNGSTDQTIENLAAGTYSIKVTDANNCVVDSQVVVKEPQNSISITSKIKNISCKGFSDGTIELSATGANGGTDPLQFYYIWSDGFIGSNRGGLAAGTYTVEVIDFLGCSKVESIKVEEPLQSLTLATDISAEKCFGFKNGTAVVTAIGGVAPYQYLWSTGDTTFQFSNFQKGAISVRVTDYNGCIRETSQFVNGPEPIQLTSEVTDVLCHDGSDGKVRLYISGGTWPYDQVEISNSESYTNVDLGFTNEATSLKAGTYLIIGKDKNGCQIPPTKATIKQPEPIIVSVIEAVSPRGFGLADGKLQFSVKGGTSPTGNYATSWQVGGAPFGSFTTTSSTNELITQSSNAIGGNYMVTVTDNNYDLATDKKGCKAEFTYFLKQPDKLEATSIIMKKPSCAGKVDGEIRANIKGGVPFTTTTGLMSDQYKLKWFKKNNDALIDLNSTEESIPNAEAGIYVVSVTDRNDISATFELELTQTPGIIATFRTVPPQCINLKTGSIELANY